MTNWKNWRSSKSALAAGAAALVAVGVAAGAGAEAMTRPAVEMAPAQPVAIGSLPQREGIVTVKGKVAEIYGDRFVVADGSGRAMVDAGRGGASVQAGAPVTVQGHYDNGQLRASFIVDRDNVVEQVGPRGPHGRHGPHGPGGPGDGGPEGPPPGGPGAPPPAGCASGAMPDQAPPPAGDVRAVALPSAGSPPAPRTR